MILQLFYFRRADRGRGPLLHRGRQSGGGRPGEKLAWSGAGLQTAVDGSMDSHYAAELAHVLRAHAEAQCIDKFAAVMPDPATGKPVPAVVKAFNATHH
jgi:hypothetical protein